MSLFIAASLVACSGGAEMLTPRPSSPSHADGGSRRPMFLNLGNTQPVLTGTALIPLSLSVSNGVGTLSVFGSTYCSAASGLNPCPNINFMASPPMWQNPSPIAFSMAAAVLNAACNAPASAPTPAPGFTPGCYVGAYEGGSGPYLIQGPVTGSAGSLSVPVNTSSLNFNPGEAYNFFLMYVTAISSPPPPPTPTPVPSPTAFATQPPPATPTPIPTPTTRPTPNATPTPAFTPYPCATATWGERDDDTDGDDGGSSCSSPSPKPTPTCAGDDGGDRHHRDVSDRRRGDDDGTCCSEDGGDHHKRHSDSRSAHGHHHHRHHHDGDCEQDD